MPSSSSSSSDETSASELSTSNCETLNPYSSTNDLDNSFLKYEKQTSSQVRYYIYFLLKTELVNGFFFVLQYIV